MQQSQILIHLKPKRKNLPRRESNSMPPLEEHALASMLRQSFFANIAVNNEFNLSRFAYYILAYYHASYYHALFAKSKHFFTKYIYYILTLELQKKTFLFFLSMYLPASHRNGWIVLMGLIADRYQMYKVTTFITEYSSLNFTQVKSQATLCIQYG